VFKKKCKYLEFKGIKKILVLKKKGAARIKMSLDEKTQEEYDKRFSEKDIKWLKGDRRLKVGRIIPKVANRFDERFDGRDIFWIRESHCPPDIANKYDEHFRGADIGILFKHGVLPEEANKFDERFGGESIRWIHWHGCQPEEANKYDPRLCEEFVYELVGDWITPGKFGKYDDRFNEEQVNTLFSKNIYPEKANQYPKRFNSDEIRILYKAYVSPSIANEYDNLLNATEISILYKIGIMPNLMTDDLKEKIHSLFSDFEISAELNLTSGNFSLISTGSQGIVFLETKQEEEEIFLPSELLFFDDEEKPLEKEIELSAWKFSLGIKEEARLLRKLNNPNYVLRIKGEVKKEIGLEMEYIGGWSLESVIDKSALKNPKTIIKIGYNIFQGLEELESADIYHRDIRPSNIIIDKKNKRAVIIDLGIATDNHDELPKDNTRYGGTDLMSLGQLIYKMATGGNLFADYGKPSAEMKEIIQQRRNDYINNESVRKIYEKKIRDNIKDKRLEDAIITCLNAGIQINEKQLSTPKEIREKAYSQLREMFMRYVR